MTTPQAVSETAQASHPATEKTAAPVHKVETPPAWLALSMHKVETPPAWLALSDQDLASSIDDVDGAIALHLSKLKPLHEVNAAMRAELVRRMKEADAQAIVHPDLIVQIETETKIEKRVNVLRELEPLVPADELKKALWLEVPEPEWKTHAGQLEALAKRYGGKIREIVTRGVVRSVVGAKLVVKRREIDVTPPKAVS